MISLSSRIGGKLRNLLNVQDDHLPTTIDEIPQHSSGNALECVRPPRRNDKRLFPNDLLYCEGIPRPSMRGVLHLICCLLFPLGFYHLYLEANDVYLGEIAAEIYIGCNLFCTLMSSLYHLGYWSPSFEIKIQKLDHCGIAVCTAGINIPVSLLLLPRQYGIPLAILSVIFCAWTCYNVYVLHRPGVWRLVITASLILFFMPILFFHMTNFELYCVFSNILAQGLGVFIFLKRYPDLLPHFFGYHEVFHVCTVWGFLSVYFCNWSVIRRTCNPYAYQLDVREIIKLWFLAISQHITNNNR